MVIFHSYVSLPEGSYRLGASAWATGPPKPVQENISHITASENVPRQPGQSWWFQAFCMFQNRNKP